MTADQRFIGVACFLVTAFFSGTSYSQENYSIDAGDILSIVVFDEEDMSLPKIRIPSNGRVSLPLVGELNVKGLTETELENRITNILLDGYLKRPRVAVNIVEYRPFFVGGEVGNPGAYPFVDGLNVRKAVSYAGGMTNRASEKKIRLVRNGQELKKVDLNTMVAPGDVITIGESLF